MDGACDVKSIEWWHGSTTGYYSRDCRCFDCIDAATDYQREWKRKNAGTLSPRDPRHGTWNAYNNYGCRCKRCKAASTEYQRARREATT